jgi:hypothetical protein
MARAAAASGTTTRGRRHGRGGAPEVTTLSAARLLRDRSLRAEVLDRLRGGFKWSEGGVTDGVTEVDMTPSFRVKGGKLLLAVEYAHSPLLVPLLGVALRPRGSVFSRSEAEVSKVELLAPAGGRAFYPVVFVAGAVRHWRR